MTRFLFFFSIACLLFFSAGAQQTTWRHYNFGKSGAVTYANGPEYIADMNGGAGLKRLGHPVFFADAPADKKMKGRGPMTSERDLKSY